MAMHDLYDGARQAFGTQQLNWPTCAPYLQLIGSGYNADPSHQYLSEVPALARVGVPLPLTGVSMERGIARAESVALGVGYAGSFITAALIFANAGAENVSRLIAFYSNVLGLPGIIPAGGSIWTWDAVNGCFRV